MGKGGGGEEEGRAMLLHGRRAQIYTPTAALFAKTVNMRSDLEARTTTLHRRIIEWAVAFRIPNSENTWLKLSKADAQIDEQTIICKVCKAAWGGVTLCPRHPHRSAPEMPIGPTPGHGYT